jgi:hypothetical protein
VREGEAAYRAAACSTKSDHKLTYGMTTTDRRSGRLTDETAATIGTAGSRDAHGSERAVQSWIRQITGE